MTVSRILQAKGTVGILSERDIVRAIARNGIGVMEHPAATTMTQSPPPSAMRSP